MSDDPKPRYDDFRSPMLEAIDRLIHSVHGPTNPTRTTGVVARGWRHTQLVEEIGNYLQHYPDYTNEKLSELIASAANASEESQSNNDDHNEYLLLEGARHLLLAAKVAGMCKIVAERKIETNTAPDPLAISQFLETANRLFDHFTNPDSA